MGIPSNRAAPRYDDVEYDSPPHRGPRVQRVVYRDAVPTARVAPRVVRRRVVDDYDDMDLPGREVVEIVERRVPQRRVQVVKKVPIHQRVVKKIIVQKVARPSFGNKREGAISRIQSRGPIQKKKFAGGRKQDNGAGPSQRQGGKFKKDQKPKLSATELDRELDEYMRGSKHPRVNL